MFYFSTAKYNLVIVPSSVMALRLNVVVREKSWFEYWLNEDKVSPFSKSFMSQVRMVPNG